MRPTGENDMNIDGGILVIDSDDTIRDLLTEFFGAQGNRVYPVGDLTEAIRVIDTVRAPVALIDIGLGSSDVLDEIERLRQADPDLKIILLSGSPTVDSVIDALRMNVFDFVVKPFCLKDLKGIVNRALTENRGRTTLGIMRRRIDMLEKMLHNHGLTPPDDAASKSAAATERALAVHEQTPGEIP